MKQLIITLLLAVLCSGCTCYISYNRFRFGHTNDEYRTLADGSELLVERTLGIDFRWAPDIDLSK